MVPVLLSIVVISFSGVMMPGPMTAVTLAKSYRSPWAGVMISLGHAVIEIPLILLIFLGFAEFFKDSIVQLVLSFLGGGMIIWLGIAMFRTRLEVISANKDLSYNSFVAGIMTSVFNPFFLLWWATVGSMLIMKFTEFGVAGIITFAVVHWLCDLVWLSFISVIVYRTHRLWGRRFQEWTFIACSALLVGFGGWFIASGIQSLLR
jgi:threonine/homoserine/homoserine lactone efflux protein